MSPRKLALSSEKHSRSCETGTNIQVSARHHTDVSSSGGQSRCKLVEMQRDEGDRDVQRRVERRERACPRRGPGSSGLDLIFAEAQDVATSDDAVQQAPL